MSMRRTLILSTASLLVSCSRSNNLLGRVEARVASHTVVVTDCYRTSVPPPQQDGETYRFAPCRDAVVVIRAEQLTVNGVPYGRLHPGDAVIVDHGRVSIEKEGRRRT
jgi:hypothetical protein